jgi:hypothetical protein
MLEVVEGQVREVEALEIEKWLDSVFKFNAERFTLTRQEVRHLVEKGFTRGFNIGQALERESESSYLP